MNEWLERFYRSNETRSALRTSLRPLYEQMGDDIAALAAEEVGLPAVEVDAFIDSMIERSVTGYLESSRAQLQEAAGSDDPLGAIRQRMDDWVQNRGSKVADEETIRTANSVSQAVYKDAGITKKKWQARGNSCPYCKRMSGRVVGIEKPFHSAGDSIVVPDSEVATKAALSFNKEIGHPPQHAGCDCVLEAELESRADVDMGRVKKWQQQQPATLRQYLKRKDLHPTDRAEIHLALIRKTKKPHATLPKPKAAKPVPAAKKPVHLGDLAAPPKSGARVPSGSPMRATVDWAKDLWGTKSGPFFSSLPKNELDALTRYSGSDYRNVNKFLRKGTGGSAALQRRIESLESAIGRTALDQDVIVTRRTTLSAFDRYHPKTFIGQNISEPGFMSTSTKSLSDLAGFDHSVRLNITAPRGTRAIYMEPITTVKGEQEILFNRGTRMRVDKVVERKVGGKTEYVVDVTIVP